MHNLLELFLKIGKRYDSPIDRTQCSDCYAAVRDLRQHGNISLQDLQDCVAQCSVCTTTPTLAASERSRGRAQPPVIPTEFDGQLTASIARVVVGRSTPKLTQKRWVAYANYWPRAQPVLEKDASCRVNYYALSYRS